MIVTDRSFKSDLFTVTALFNSGDNYPNYSVHLYNACLPLFMFPGDFDGMQTFAGVYLFGLVFDFV